MTLLDANVLLYASNARAEQHLVARAWRSDALAGHESVLVPWVTSLALLRIATNPRAMAQTLSISEAFGFLRPLLNHRRVLVVDPDSRHLERVEAMLQATGTGGNLATDAHLAAMALQHEAAVVSFDRDFGRFPSVRWELPGAARN